MTSSRRKAAVGSIVGSLVALVVVGALLALVVLRRRKRRQAIQVHAPIEKGLGGDASDGNQIAATPHWSGAPENRALAPNRDIIESQAEPLRKMSTLCRRREEQAHDTLANADGNEPPVDVQDSSDWHGTPENYVQVLSLDPRTDLERGVIESQAEALRKMSTAPRRRDDRAPVNAPQDILVQQMHAMAERMALFEAQLRLNRDGGPQGEEGPPEYTTG
ncbi:hypothetical protein C8F01DRAFT_1121746 [Mycena amicta]|nr:hypothetical protein C8F01DRAFT_1121746 [Mycena amicta]